MAVARFKPLTFSYSINISSDYSNRISVVRGSNEEKTEDYYLFAYCPCWEDLDRARADLEKTEDDIRSGRLQLERGEPRNVG